MVLSFFAKVIILQVIVISIIIFILKIILDKRLIESAISEMRLWQQEGRKVNDSKVIVISHKEVHPRYKERIHRITYDYLGEGHQPDYRIDKSILGGLIILIGNEMIECSLKDRLNQAFSR